MSDQEQQKPRGRGFSKLPKLSTAGPFGAGESDLAPAEINEIGTSGIVDKIEAAQASSGSVRVVSGSHDQMVNGVVGKSVAQVRASMEQVFNIAHDARALVNGHEVAGAYQLGINDVLEFVKPAGTKGERDI